MKTTASIKRGVELDLNIESLAYGGMGSVSYTHLTLPTNREV